ncbi:head-tail adaptor protein [Celeribacter sp.]|uniref:head-tail adaptor protein n=1 Tax=Celeribacter sp. TaxID=1890673 RepID=UPI003A918821
MGAVSYLNRHLTLEEPQRVSDGAGGYVESWVPLGSLWASIEAGTGSKRSEDFATISVVPLRITVRGAPVGSPSRPKPEQRFTEGARTYVILSVTEADPMGHYLICQAREEVSS